MALLALTLALLAMTVATRIIKEKPLDMALDSFDDQYQGCGPAMKEALPALHRSEFQKNPRFAKYWSAAVAEWQKLGSPVSPLSSSDQAIAIRAYTSILLHVYFNDKVRTLLWGQALCAGCWWVGHPMAPPDPLSHPVTLYPMAPISCVAPSPCYGHP
uniref:NAD(P)(+)--arginine ADP-ribosyltransferase n=1 Tax=Catharus ustulatus TaxID=91951 RepID=A0A8C3UMJ9_CATUS